MVAAPQNQSSLSPRPSKPSRFQPSRLVNEDVEGGRPRADRSQTTQVGDSHMIGQIVCLLVTFQGTPQKTEGKPLLEFAVNVHRANQGKFDRGVFRFELTYGEANSIDDAIQGRFHRTALTSGSYAFEGKDAVYECVASDEDLKSNTVQISEREDRTTLFSHRLLTDNAVTCLDFLYLSGKAMAHRAVIEQDREGALFNGSFQFIYWIGEPADRASRLVEDWEREKQGAVTFAGGSLNNNGSANLTFNVGKTQRRYEIDLERGGVPVSIIDVDALGKPLMHVHYNNLKKLDSGGWMPLEKLVYLPQAKIVRRFQVTSYDCAKHVPKETFVLKFPEPLQISDKSTRTVLRKVSNLRLSDRSRLPSTPFTAFPASTKQIESLLEQPGVQEAGHWRLLGSALIVVLLFIPVVGLFFKRRALKSSNGRRKTGS